MDVQFLDDGRMRVPHHDGVLVGLVYEASARLTLTIRCVDGLMTRIDLLGIHDMNLAHICDGTIVSAICGYPVRKLRDMDDPGFGWLNPAALAEGHRQYGAPSPQAMVTRAARDHPDAYLVTMSSSFGGDLYAVCDRIEVSHDSVDAEHAGR